MLVEYAGYMLLRPYAHSVPGQARALDDEPEASSYG